VIAPVEPQDCGGVREPPVDLGDVADPDDSLEL